MQRLLILLSVTAVFIFMPFLVKASQANALTTRVTGQEEKELLDQIRAAEAAGDSAKADQLKAQFRSIHQAQVQILRTHREPVKIMRHDVKAAIKSGNTLSPGVWDPKGETGKNLRKIKENAQEFRKDKREFEPGQHEFRQDIRPIPDGRT